MKKRKNLYENTIKSGLLGKKVQIWPIAVEGANIGKLQEISTTPVKSLTGLKFPELFLWLTGTLSTLSRTRPGDSVQLPSTDPWSSVRV